jgi:CHASE2 domain-containing sensor protein
MPGSKIKNQKSKIPIVAATATVLLGWLLLLPLGSPNPLVRYSYDLLQLFVPEHSYTNLVLILMDDQAMQDYGQQSAQRWPRTLHARLLDRLSQDEPKVVVFDVSLTQPSDLADDNELARAIGRNGRVVLAANREPVPGVGRSYTIVPPMEQFETNAAGWGIAKVIRDPDQGVRRYDNGDDQYPGLAWAAAAAADAPVTRDPKRRLAEERWLNYYGVARPFQSFSMTYSNAETRPPGFFRGKAVFIGGKPTTLLRGEITDVFSTPFTKWNSSFIPGVELTAIAYSNLLHEDWLRRLAFPVDVGLLLVTGIICGFGLHKLRLRPALWTALGIAAVLVAAALGGMLLFGFWFPWMVVGLAQLPCAVTFRFQAERWAKIGQLEIPDHTLIRCIGQGAYGQVWVARNEIGIYHAVKVVYRNRFGTDEPYERALRGIRKFMPISRSHEGFVHILHIGKNEKRGTISTQASTSIPTLTCLKPSPVN